VCDDIIILHLSYLAYPHYIITVHIYGLQSVVLDSIVFKVCSSDIPPPYLCTLITFRMSRRRREMYCGHPRLCVCVCVSVCLSTAVCPHYCTDPDVAWGMVEVAPSCALLQPCMSL